MTTVDGKALPAIVLSSVGPAPLRAWDSLWVVADTLWLRSDSTAQELGAFVDYRTNAAGETPTVEYDTTIVRGLFRVDRSDPTVRTWASTDDPVIVSNGGAQISRSIQFAPFTSNPRRLVRYRRLQ